MVLLPRIPKAGSGGIPIKKRLYLKLSKCKIILFSNKSQLNIQVGFCVYSKILKTQLHKFDKMKQTITVKIFVV